MLGIVSGRVKGMSTEKPQDDLANLLHSGQPGRHII